MMSKAGSINSLLSSSMVSWPFCSELSSLVEGPYGTSSCVFCRGNVRLLLPIKTIMHSASVPMPPPITCWVPAQSSSVSTLCQLVPSIVSSQCQVGCLLQLTKSPCQVTLQGKWLFGCLWCRSRIRAHNKLSEAEKLLDKKKLLDLAKKLLDFVSGYLALTVF